MNQRNMCVSAWRASAVFRDETRSSSVYARDETFDENVFQAIWIIVERTVTNRKRDGAQKTAVESSYLADGAVERTDKYYRDSPGILPLLLLLLLLQLFRNGRFRRALGAIAAIYNVNEQSLRVHVDGYTWGQPTDMVS